MILLVKCHLLKVKIFFNKKFIFYFILFFITKKGLKCKLEAKDYIKLTEISEEIDEAK